MVRTPYCDKSGLRKGTWTPEEDNKLIAYVTRYGCWNWRQLPKFAGLSRCGKSCRLRWMNYLKPNLKRGNYTKDEDELIIKLHESLGNKWSTIAAHLPGRTDNEVKNHWHTSLKKSSKQKSISGESNSKRSSKKLRKKVTEPENSPTSSTTQEILESSQYSSQLSSSSSPSSSEPSFSSTTTASDGLDCTNVVAEFDDFVADIFAESSGSFWTEPFLTDNYSTINYPPSPFTSEVLLCAYDYYDDNVNSLLW